MTDPKLHRLRVFTGPCAVKQIADALRAADLDVACEGTQHVIFHVLCAWPADPCAVALDRLQACHGLTFGLSPELY